MEKDRWKEQSDEKLISQMQQGTAQVWDYLVNKYKGTVRSLANRYYLIGADKEDLVQEGMIGLFKAVRDYRPDRNASFYSFAVLCIKREMFTAINKYHSKKNSPLNNYVSFSAKLEENSRDQETAGKLLDVLEAESAFDPVQAAIDKEFLETFEETAKDFLSETEGKVLHLMIQGKGYREIADALSMSPKSADNAVQRCKQKLTKFLDQKT